MAQEAPAAGGWRKGATSDSCRLLSPLDTAGSGLSARQLRAPAAAWLGSQR